MAQSRRRYTLGRRFSLGRNKYHQIVYRRGKSYPGRMMVLVYLKGGDMKVAFSTSSKVGNAVVRNRIRRCMREDFRMLRPRLRSGRYIFVARKSAAGKAHALLTEDMHALLRRANLLAPGEGEDT